nr:MAG TPA: hypothetical protein [Caudoviricetes sp.]
MPEYIERNKVIELLRTIPEVSRFAKSSVEAYQNMAERCVMIMPSDNVAPVVCCKDCIYAAKAEWRVLPMVCCTHPKMGGYGAARATDDYCSYGKREDEDDGD